ncbi:sensor histidine kinase [Mobilitalea sibirica]|uniref:histidine kinase n=1 Tax=Mobilitalea sibirica TaxID=1462919 RepID=A0A8J7KSA6_9FIRM|nr:sensor histidine kinase [Mobilitalea sibirica]MBH1940116.1 sensor histidine kinase [Mobilitalea sibirica]
MALTIIFMIFFSIVLAIRNYKNRNNLLFILMVLGMSISMFTIVSEIYKSSNYLVPSYYVYSGIEYKMFLFLSQVFRLPLSNLLILRNLGIITYLIAIMLFVITFSTNVKSKHQGIKPVGHFIRYLGLVAYPILYYVFYHPNTAYNFYLFRHSLQDESSKLLWIRLVTITDFIMVCIAFLYLLYPVVLLILSHRKNKITFFSEQLLGLALSLSLLNSIFFMVFFTGAFKTSVNSVFSSAFWRYKLAVIVPTYYATAMPVLSLIILMIILYITIKFKTDSLINGIKERSIKKNLSSLNSNLKDVLHSNKNVMFNMKILAQEAIHNYGTSEGQKKLEKILALSDSHMNAISKALDNIRELKMRTIKNNLIDAVETALSETAIPEYITVTKTYHDTNVFCNFDMYHMTQVIANLITNSIDAIKSRENSNATINIIVDSSKDWIYLSIQDSGCGIPKRLLNKIFNPYFSTKSKQNNWGIGLSYVFRVINSHFGHIRIKSKPGEYTNVEILLPRSTK